jgi:5-methyltetrahydropteroyltriglutamate--homocysteine methyltransferase
MDFVEQHPYPADASFDGGSLDCGNGLLLLIRKHIDPLTPGQLLEIRSTESSVEEDLPAWCRLTRNELVSCVRQGGQRSYLVCKGPLTLRPSPPLPSPAPSSSAAELAPQRRDEPAAPRIAPAPVIPPLSVMGIGSWPRPRWLLQTLHDYLAGRLPEADWQETADDAVRLAVEAQVRAGVDVVTDGEQRRDNYASFVGARLDNCQLIPIADLLPYVDDPQKFEAELRALDVPLDEVRHPAVFGRLQRSRPLAVHELEFVRTLTDRPVKVALPGPYLLTRTMWMECISDRAYASREELAEDVLRVLREEVCALLAAGAAIVQLDEPVLTEVVFGRPAGQRSFMCGALGEKLPVAEELAFAGSLINRVVAGLPRSRTALHVCRGNWTRDESVALRGDYRPLLPLLGTLEVGTLFLELCTPRAGEMEVLRELPESCRIGVGVVNQKSDAVESVEEIVARAEAAVRLFGAERVLLTPDCGFATFADNPVNSVRVAEAKLAAVAQAAQLVRRTG